MMKYLLPSVLTMVILIGSVWAQESSIEPIDVAYVSPSFRIVIACEEDPQPTTVRLLSGGIVIQGKGEQTNQSPYSIVLDSRGKDAFFTGTVEVKWETNVDAHMDIQIPALPGVSKATLFFFRPEVEPNIESIERFRAKGLSGTNAFKTYFEAKSIYKRTYSKHPRHQVTVLAAYYWHEAAFALSQDYNSIIEMDGEARIALDKVREDLKNEDEGENVREILSAHGIRETYVAGILEQSGALEWRHASNIALAAQSGEFNAADILNRYYIDKWKSADSSERSTIMEYFKVNGDWLEDNSAFLTGIIKHRNLNM